MEKVKYTKDGETVETTIDNHIGIARLEAKEWTKVD